MARPIGKVLALRETAAQDSSARLIAIWESTDLTVLERPPPEMTLTDLVAVGRIASLPLPALPPAPEDHTLKCLRMLTILPTKSDDDLTGELRLAVYRRHLGRYCEEALSFLASEATRTCRWLPTPAECIAILNRWTRQDLPARAKRYADLVMRTEYCQRRDAALDRLRWGRMGQEEFDALPERWRASAVELAYVRAVDGRRIVRSPA